MKMNEAAMGQLLIRNVPDDVIDTLKTKARLNGTSLEQYLRNLIEASTPFSAAECQALSREFLVASGGPWEPLSKDDYREGLA